MVNITLLCIQHLRETTGLQYFWLQCVVISSLLWGVNRPRVLVTRIYRRGGTAYRPRMGQRGCRETTINKHNSTLCNTPEEQISHSHRGGSLKSWKCLVFMYERDRPLPFFHTFLNIFYIDFA